MHTNMNASDAILTAAGITKQLDKEKTCKNTHNRWSHKCACRG